MFIERINYLSLTGLLSAESFFKKKTKETFSQALLIVVNSGLIDLYMGELLLSNLNFYYY